MQKAEESKIKSTLTSYRSMILLIIGIAVGCIIGTIFGERAMALKPLGQLFLNMMFTAVVPLVFFSLSSSVAGMSNMKRLSKILGNTLAMFVITGIIASIIMIIIVGIFPPAKGININLGAYEVPETMNFLDQVVKAISVSDFNLILSKSAMLPLIIFSVTLGYCITSLNKDGKGDGLIGTMEYLNEALMKMIGLVMKYAPIGLGAYFAAMIGEYGSQLMGAYTRAVVMFFPICILYFLIGFTAYAYYAGGMNGVKVFYKYIFPAVVTSIATQSSIATLPTNFACCKKMGCSDDVSSLVLPMGATIHMDGTVLTTLMKIAFLFGVFDIPFTGLGTWATAIVIAILTGVVLSGVPGGGILGEIIIVGFYGFNPEVIPIIITIGLLTDPIATMLNSTGDSVTAMVVTRRLEGKDWLEKKIASGEVVL